MKKSQDMINTLYLVGVILSDHDIWELTGEQVCLQAQNQAV
jgi:hypothetical protein